MGNWRRVTRRHPCPICGRTGWCAVTDNGELCLCMRAESDWPAKDGMGGHFHRLAATLSVARPRLPRRKATAFDPRMRGTISAWILDRLALEEPHYEHLKGAQRRLTMEQIVRRRYRSWPGASERAELATQGVREFGAMMREYPGFYIDRNGLPALAGPEGLLLPVADDSGRVVAFQIRPDDATIGKRLWLSSAGRRSGTGSGAPAHFSYPAFVRDPFTAYVVEGVLSADICSDTLGAPCIGIAGKTNWRTLDPERLATSLVERIVIALDQDDPNVQISEEARDAGQFLGNHVQVQFASWDGNRAKGFDDCLIKKLRFAIS